nr:hypothetical protein [Tanacetum cinerariifolium]
KWCWGSDGGGLGEWCKWCKWQEKGERRVLEDGGNYCALHSNSNVGGDRV